jgi:hypothetical protein
MAKVQYGTWAKAPDEVGKITWTPVSGTALSWDLSGIVGDVEWTDLDPIAQFGLGYGFKQWVSDGLAGKARNLSEYVGMLQERAEAFMQGEAVTGGYPFAAEAIAKVKGISIEKAKAVWADATSEKRATWYGLTNVQAAVKLIKQERERARNEVLVAVSAGLDDFDVEE